MLSNICLRIPCDHLIFTCNTDFIPCSARIGLLSIYHSPAVVYGRVQIPYTTAEEWYTEICPYTTAGQCNMVSNTMWYLEEIRAENGIIVKIGPTSAEFKIFRFNDP